jgi:trimeric autotransporter adhesin
MRTLSRSMLLFFLSAVALAQQASIDSATVVPTLVNFSGVVRDLNGKPLTELVGVTFSLYKEAQGGPALWMETQNIQPDESGHYSAALGSTTSEGLPSDLFAAGQARWLGVQIQGQSEQPRVLLLSVPYALKAADAQTLGGLPPSAFMQTPTGAAARATTATAATTTAGSAHPSATSNVTTTGGTANTLPLFTTPTNVQNSIVTQRGTSAIDVKGQLNALTAPGGAGILNSTGNANHIGFSTVGWNSTDFSHGTDAIHATGGYGNTGIVATGGSTENGASGAGGIFTGGYGGADSLGLTGAGIIATGGAGGDCCGGDGIIANGGAFGGTGVVVTGGFAGDSPFNGPPGIVTLGGEANEPNNPGQYQNGPGITASGESDSQSDGGDGIDAIAGTGSCSGCSNGLAGSFSGNVNIAGNLSVSGTKSFKIDHPLDPANKYLYHAALESSEVLNLYSGNATLDTNGEATVQLPDWFEALNRDFRYQLTAIGAAAPGLHIAQEIQNHSFRIAGGAAAMKVSWQVTAVRQDAWEKAHPMVVEVPKPPRERGYYINPELFGAPAEKNIDWAHMPEVMKRLQALRAKQAAQKKASLVRPVKAARP